MNISFKDEVVRFSAVDKMVTVEFKEHAAIYTLETSRENFRETMNALTEAWQKGVQVTVTERMGMILSAKIE